MLLGLLILVVSIAVLVWLVTTHLLTEALRSWIFAAGAGYAFATIGYGVLVVRSRSASNVLNSSSYAPILLLRPFGDDHYRLPGWWIYRYPPWMTQEWLIARVLRKVGPLVAIGNPWEATWP